MIVVVVYVNAMISAIKDHCSGVDLNNGGHLICSIMLILSTGLYNQLVCMFALIICGSCSLLTRICILLTRMLFKQKRFC